MTIDDDCLIVVVVVVVVINNIYIILTIKCVFVFCVYTIKFLTLSLIMIYDYVVVVDDDDVL